MACVWTLANGAFVMMNSADDGCLGPLLALDDLGSSAELKPSVDASRLDELLSGAIDRVRRSSSRT